MDINKGKEGAQIGDSSAGGITKMGQSIDGADMGGTYHVECIGPDGKLKWKDDIKNAVTQEGKVVALNAALKASGFTQASYLGLISATGYTTPPANTNTAAQINTAASGNGWNEVVAGVVANRGTPSWGTSTGSGGNASLATTATSFSILGPLTIKGCFLMLKDLTGTSPTNAVGNTAGAMYSAGLFTGGDKVVTGGDTLNVTYTASMT